jgi:hypothetical protein
MPAHCPQEPLKTNIYIPASRSAAPIVGANFSIPATPFYLPPTYGNIQIVSNIFFTTLNPFH